MQARRANTINIRCFYARDANDEHEKRMYVVRVGTELGHKKKGPDKNPAPGVKSNIL